MFIIRKESHKRGERGGVVVQSKERLGRRRRGVDDGAAALARDALGVDADNERELLDDVGGAAAVVGVPLKEAARLVLDMRDVGA